MRSVVTNHVINGFEKEQYSQKHHRRTRNDCQPRKLTILSKKFWPVRAEFLQYVPPGPGRPHCSPSVSSCQRNVKKKQAIDLNSKYLAEIQTVKVTQNYSITWQANK